MEIIPGNEKVKPIYKTFQVARQNIHDNEYATLYPMTKYPIHKISIRQNKTVQKLATSTAISLNDKLQLHIGHPLHQEIVLMYL